jgi:3-hydroxybutyryl-CoA dehydrogenase
MTDPPADIEPASDADLRVVGIVGAGVMGSGIAQLALEAGHEVVIHDVDEAALEGGRERIRAGLVRPAGRAVPEPERADWVDERLARLRSTAVLEQLGDEADIVVEAALESLDLKRTVFRTLDSVADPAVILATNTSALSIAAIAAATTRPERVLGLHFFNPAPVMRLVEVVATPSTDEALVGAATQLVATWGRTPVRSADAPGFIVNRANRPFTLGALRLVERGLAGVRAIDDAIRNAGFPLGPFELMDLTGIDVTYAASTAIWEGLGRPDRLRPSPLQAERVAAGHLGRKTGEGFHRYADGRPVGVAELPALPPAEGTAPQQLGPDEIQDRILLPIVDEAHRLVAEGVASSADTDVALRLGAAHPLGPFERARELGGAATVASRLRELAALQPELEPSEALLRG